jgi:hypothetical protein
MIVAVDLDEVVFNFVDPYFEFLSEKYKKPLTRSMLTSDWSCERAGLTPKNSSRENLLEFGELGGFKNLELMPGARSALFDMALLHSIVFVTSREPESRYDTEYSLNELGYHHIPLYFSNHTGTTKGMILQNMGVHYFIDDNPEYINEVRHRYNTCVSILMSQIPASIMAVGGGDIVSGWDELRKKRPALFTAKRI